LWFYAFYRDEKGSGRNVHRGLNVFQIKLRFAKNTPSPVSPEQRRTVVESRLVTRKWPAHLKVTAIDADTGQLHTFDHQSGTSLFDAVSASGAVPGIWPLVSIGDRFWTDGGMVSTTNVTNGS
jgi:NTE family protein